MSAWVACCLTVVQQFCNSEIQQLWNSRRRYQDIRRLEIPMNDEVLVGVVHRGANRLKQFQSGIDVQPMRIAESIDGDAVDVLHDDVGASVRQGPAVQEMSDVRMIELGQNLAFQLEPRVHPDRQRSPMHDFDRHLLLELRIGAFGQINLAHAAGTQGAQHPIRSYAISHHFWSMHPDQGQLQTTAPGLAGGGRLRVCRQGLMAKP
jgi:hypothetical protein